MQFFELKSADAVRALVGASAPPGQQAWPLDSEFVGLLDAVDRVTAVPVAAPHPLPSFPRSVVDGFAVRAQDTFGCSSGGPAYLELLRPIPMGAAATEQLRVGTAAPVATGGMLPEFSDAVVMVEHAEITPAGMLEVIRPVAPGEGMVRAGDDLAEGSVAVPSGRRLRPEDVGLLAALGVVALEVWRRPVVGILPTGDEVVEPGSKPAPGQVRDVNSYLLGAELTRRHAEPRAYPIVPDDPGLLRAALDQALSECDLVLLAGGSSVGTRDHALEVLLGLPQAQLLVHGVAVRPGKPLIVVHSAGRLIFGLPGHPVSALLSFQQFVVPHLRWLTGETETESAGLVPSVPAQLTRPVPSQAGREDHLRVRLTRTFVGWEAEPLLGKSTLLHTLVEGHGTLVVPAAVEGLERGEWVEIQLA